MIRMTTLFPLCENVHLTKDVGMIPYLMHKDHNYDCTIVCYKNGEYPALKSDVKGLKQVFIKRIFGRAALDSLWYVLTNSRKIDVLQVFHLSIGSIFILPVFKALKIFSKTAVTYLKLDEGAKVKEVKYTGITGYIAKFLLSKVDVVSVETIELYQFLNSQNTLGRPISYLPNGFYPLSELVTYKEKRNLIITVGRIGTHVKANEILLKAFELFSECNQDWDLEFVGPVEESFQSTIDNFFSNNPHLFKRVNFSGPINDKLLLKRKYDEAKIFVLTSRSEGFPLVFLEAMKSGCTIISTDLIVANDVTDNGIYGEKFKIDNYEALSEILLKKANDEEFLRSNTLAIQEYAKKKFYWPDIVKQLNDLIEPKVSA